MSPNIPANPLPAPPNIPPQEASPPGQEPKPRKVVFSIINGKCVPIPPEDERVRGLGNFLQGQGLKDEQAQRLSSYIITQNAKGSQAFQAIGPDRKLSNPIILNQGQPDEGISYLTGFSNQRPQERPPGGPAAPERTPPAPPQPDPIPQQQPVGLENPRQPPQLIPDPQQSPLAANQEVVALRREIDELRRQLQQQQMHHVPLSQGQAAAPMRNDAALDLLTQKNHLQQIVDRLDPNRQDKRTLETILAYANGAAPEPAGLAAHEAAAKEIIFRLLIEQYNPLPPHLKDALTGLGQRRVFSPGGQESIYNYITQPNTRRQGVAIPAFSLGDVLAMKGQFEEGLTRYLTDGMEQIDEKLAILGQSFQAGGQLRENLQQPEIGLQELINIDREISVQLLNTLSSIKEFFESRLFSPINIPIGNRLVWKDLLNIPDQIQDVCRNLFQAEYVGLPQEIRNQFLGLEQGESFLSIAQKKQAIVGYFLRCLREGNAMVNRGVQQMPIRNLTEMQGKYAAMTTDLRQKLRERLGGLPDQANALRALGLADLLGINHLHLVELIEKHKALQAYEYSQNSLAYRSANATLKGAWKLGKWGLSNTVGRLIPW